MRLAGSGHGLESQSEAENIHHDVPLAVAVALTLPGPGGPRGIGHGCVLNDVSRPVVRHTSLQHRPPTCQPGTGAAVAHLPGPHPTAVSRLPGPRCPP
jgi:hypothetical protein